MKAAGGFAVHLDPRLDLPDGLRGVIAQIGAEATPAPGSPDPDGGPAVLLIPPGATPPDAWREHSVEVPEDIRPVAFAALLRAALENTALRAQVRRMEAEASRYHEQFTELNRIGIALSAERDIKKLQEFILTTMRQLTNADGASLWLKTIGDDGQPKLFLASSQNTSIPCCANG